MEAFHNDPKVKEKYLTRVLRHQELDNIIQGQGWTGTKGCAVGCTLENYDHKQYEIELGIPEWLARVEDTLFEGMTKERALKWPAQFLNAINIGADLERVKTPFIIFILEQNLIYLAECKYDELNNPQVKDAIEGSKKAITEMIRCHREGLDLTAARSAAWLAAESAESAAESAARSAAWSAESAAESAARSAAWSAAWLAARLAESAAWSAAESAESAESAARLAARLAESAAESAARSAAWSAAWLAARLAESAAWSAAESAARSAAWSAAESAESAAWSAAESAAESAESAARSAAYEKYADKLLELLSATERGGGVIC